MDSWTILDTRKGVGDHENAISTIGIMSAECNMNIMEIGIGFLVKCEKGTCNVVGGYIVILETTYGEKNNADDHRIIFRTMEMIIV